MPSNLHEIIIRKLTNAGAHTKGFWKSVKSKAEKEPDWDEDNEGHYQRIQKVRPDAYYILEDDFCSRPEQGTLRTVYIYEVEVSSFLKDSKLSQYCDLAWLLDDIFWNTRLICFDRYAELHEYQMLPDPHPVKNPTALPHSIPGWESHEGWENSPTVNQNWVSIPEVLMGMAQPPRLQPIRGGNDGSTGD